MSNNESSMNFSIGFTGLLAIAFIVLRLCDVIQWSWWWVLSPLWIPVCFMLFVLFCVLIAMAIVHT